MSPEPEEGQSQAALPADLRDPDLSEAGAEASSETGPETGAEAAAAVDLARLVAELGDAVRAHLESLGGPGR